MNITSLSSKCYLSVTDSPLFTAAEALDSASAQQQGVTERVNFTFQATQKSPAFVFGEQIVRPLIDKGLHLGGGLFSLAKRGMVTADRIFSKMLPSLPGVSAESTSEQAGSKTFFKFVKSQVDKGADVNGLYSKEEGVFLQAASALGDIDAIEFLISRNADVNQRADYNSLTYNLQGFWTLVSGNVRNEIDQTPLMLAAKNRQPAAVKLLLKAKALLNLVDKDKETALFKAVKNGDTETVKLLVDAGADVDIPNESGTTPLIEAASAGNAIIVELLLTAGANPSSKNLSNMTPLAASVIGKLTRSIEKNHLKIAELLIKHGAELNTPSLGGLTPVAWAAETGKMELLKLFIEGRADLDAQDNVLGLTPLMAAAMGGGYVEVPGNIKEIYAQVLEFLIQAGAKLDIQDVFQGNTALMWATMRGHTKAVELLLKAGAKVDIKDRKQGLTALKIARSKGFEKIVRLLLAAGADPKEIGLDSDDRLNAAQGVGKDTVKPEL